MVHQFAQFPVPGTREELQKVLEAGVKILRPMFLGENNTRGKTQRLTSVGQSVVLVRLERPQTIEAPESVAVAVDVQTSGDTPNSRVRLDVEWGNNGICKAELDAVRGTCFSVPGSTVRVSAVLEGGDAVQVTASTAPGGAGSGGAGPTRTLFQSTAVVPTAFGLQVIPKWARTVNVYRNPISEPITIELLGPVTAVSVLVPGFADCPEIVLPQGAHRLRVRNDGALDITYAAVFGLSLRGGA